MTKYYSKIARLVLVAWIANLCPGTAPCIADDDLPLHKILKVWRDREDRVKSVHFEWTERRMTGKGSEASRVILSPEERDPALPASAPGPCPPKDILHDIKYSLLVADQKYFFTSYGPQWSPRVEDFRGQRYTSVFNGNTSKSLYAPDVRTKTIYAVGFVNRKQGLEDARGLQTMPLLLHFRPFSAVELDAGAFVATGQRGEVKKRICQIVSYEKVEAPGRQVSYWIDTERDCCVLRFRSVRAGRTELELDIEYDTDAGGAWFPSGWTFSRTNRDGIVNSSGSSDVTKREINIPIKDDQFQLEFPPDTHVNDRITREAYLISESGEKKPFPPRKAKRPAIQ